MSGNTAMVFIGGSKLVISGYGCEAVRIKLNEGLESNQLVEFPLSSPPMQGVNASLVCFIAPAVMTTQKLPPSPPLKLVQPSG